MRRMDCTRAAEALPLYVAGDLEDPRAREVAAHLAACEGCRRLAADFAASRSLLAQACAPPEFGPDFYAGIRNAVLGEIGRDRKPPAPSFTLALPFGRRFAYAAAFVLVILALALSLQHFLRGAREAKRELASAPPAAGAPTRVPDSDAGPSSPRPHLSPPPSPRRPRATAAKAPRSLFGSAGAARGVRDEAARAATAPAGVAPGAVGSAPRAGAAVPSAAAQAPGAEEVSRIEIQTADPNIRIIWLAPRKSEDPARNQGDHPDRN